jgi:hypothetical protein
MEAKVRAVFGPVPKGSPGRSSMPEKAPLLEKDAEIREEMDVKEAYLTIGFVGPTSNHQDHSTRSTSVERSWAGASTPC